MLGKRCWFVALAAVALAGCTGPWMQSGPSWLKKSGKTDQAFYKRVEKDSFPTPQQAGVTVARAPSKSK